MDLNLLTIETSRSYSDTPQSLVLLWTGDQSSAETSTRTIHNIHKRQTSKLPAGFEPAIPASKRSKTHPYTARQLGSAVWL